MTVAETGTDPGGTETPAVKIAFFHVLTYFENDTRVQLCVACPQGWLGEAGGSWELLEYPGCLRRQFLPDRTTWEVGQQQF